MNLTKQLFITIQAGFFSVSTAFSSMNLQYRENA